MATLQIIHISDNPRPTRTIRLGKRTLSDAIRERGLKEPKCRTFAQSQADLRKVRHDRPKTYPGDGCPGDYLWRDAGKNEIEAAHEIINAYPPADTASYVKAWALLNHLKEC